ncbi:MAG: 30S ribosomal protein S18 [Bacteriovoracia bacterium]
MAEKKERKFDDDSRDGSKDSRDEGKGGRRSFQRKKVCRFCADTEFEMDYKDGKMMSSYVTEMGKIVPRRISGTCSFHQRKLTVAVKRARMIALVGFTSSGPQ